MYFVSVSGFFGNHISPNSFLDRITIKQLLWIFINSSLNYNYYLNSGFDDVSNINHEKGSRTFAAEGPSMMSCET